MVNIIGFGRYSRITPLTVRGALAMTAHLETKPFQWSGGSLYVETALLPDIIGALTSEGAVEVQTNGYDRRCANAEALRNVGGTA